MLGFSACFSFEVESRKDYVCVRSHLLLLFCHHCEWIIGRAKLVCQKRNDDCMPRYSAPYPWDYHILTACLLHIAPWTAPCHQKCSCPLSALLSPLNHLGFNRECQGSDRETFLYSKQSTSNHSSKSSPRVNSSLENVLVIHWAPLASASWRKNENKILEWKGGAQRT